MCSDFDRDSTETVSKQFRLINKHKQIEFCIHLNWCAVLAWFALLCVFALQLLLHCGEMHAHTRAHTRTCICIRRTTLCEKSFYKFSAFVLLVTFRALRVLLQVKVTSATTRNRWRVVFVVVFTITDAFAWCICMCPQTELYPHAGYPLLRSGR